MENMIEKLALRAGILAASLVATSMMFSLGLPDLVPGAKLQLSMLALDGTTEAWAPVLA